jgi:hypothetical protein
MVHPTLGLMTVASLLIVAAHLISLFSRGEREYWARRPRWQHALFLVVGILGSSCFENVGPQR